MAEEIASKLEAKVEKKKKHDFATVWYNGKTVATFGLRRGSKAKHGFIPREIGVSETAALKLANCTMTFDEYIEVARGKGRL